ncbi:MAG: hypothetical protein K2L52_02695, partial [Clostridia bacterium]|nr:hypothetical protein [Clostridia bacterium]
MKENRKNNYLIKYIVVLAILIAMTLLLCAIPKGIGLIDNDMLQDISNSGLTNTSFNVNYPTSGGLGQFDNGVTYVYTDPTKVDDFRAGTISSDITEVTVDTSKPHGTSQQNPYVISTLADWDNFVKRMATGTNNGLGEYFVLANDIDFDGEAFHPVMIFNGNFHGVGFELQNISCSTWQYWNSSSNAWTTVVSSTTSAFGTFCNSKNGIITDLIVEDYQFSNIPITNNISSTLTRSSCVGGILGNASGAISILNCHTSGVIRGQTVSNYTSYTGWGGILGINTSSIDIYRCSATVDMNSIKYPTNYGPIFGGIIGDIPSITTTTTYTNVYDVVADFTANYIGGSYNYMGSIVSINHSHNYKIENAVSKMEITSSSANGSAGIGWCDSKSSAKLCNIYTSNFYGASNATKLPNYFASSDGYFTSSNSKLSNLHMVKPASLAYANVGVTFHTAFNSSSPLQPKLYEDIDDIYDQAMNDVENGVLPSNIWDKSKIGGFTPDTSPVRNFLTANVTFKNLLSGGGEEGVGIDTAEYRAGDTLPSPSGSYLKTNHTFRGWTTDKTGKSDPVTELPTGVFGDVTYYAVWGLTDSYVASQIKTSLSVKDNIKTIEYDSVSSIGLIGEV